MDGVPSIECMPLHMLAGPTQSSPFGFRIVKPAVELVDVFICLSCDEVKRRRIGQQPMLLRQVGRYDATVRNDAIP